MAPPGSRIRGLIDELLGWMESTDEHPLVSSCVFHYELEFIHPFMDGNGRMGRLWQTLILSKWKPLLAYLPVETVVRDRQEEYYRVLAEADKHGDATPFVESMLGALRSALSEAVDTDQVTDQATDQVVSLLRVLQDGEARAGEIMQRLGLTHRPTFRANYLNPALDANLVARSEPDSPRSPTQRYRITDAGRAVVLPRHKTKGR